MLIKRAFVFVFAPRWVERGDCRMVRVGQPGPVGLLKRRSSFCCFLRDSSYRGRGGRANKGSWGSSLAKLHHMERGTRKIGPLRIRVTDGFAFTRDMSPAEIFAIMW